MFQQQTASFCGKKDRAGDADQAAGAADDFARDDLAVAGAERVHHPAGGDALAEEGRELGDDGGVAGAGFRQHREGFFVIGFGEGGHTAVRSREGNAGVQGNVALGPARKSWGGQPAWPTLRV